VKIIKRKICQGSLSFRRRRTFCFKGQFEVVDYLVYEFIIFDK